MCDRSAFVPCIVTEYRKASSGSAQKHSGPSEETQTDRVAPGAASAALRALPRYLPWLQRDALHPSAPDATCSSPLRRRLTSLAKLRAEPGQSHNARRET